MRKQLFYLTNQQLSAYTWDRGVLALAASFEQDDAGRAGFGAWLAKAALVPAALVVDVIEEDFQRDTAPHVTGRARAALVERKLTTLYRDTPFRHAALQGREKDGRKDDRYLFNALTKPELPRSWLAVMQAHAVPLVGVYSLASLGQLLYNKLAPQLKPGSGPVLLVSHQSSGLRQSFFAEGELRFSRLTPLFDHSSPRLAEAFRIETNKTRQFLASTRLLARGAQLQVVVLASEENLAVLAPDMVDNADASYHPQALDQAGAQLRLGSFDGTAMGDALYLAMLAGARVPSHFPLRDQKHFYQLLRARGVLYAMSGVVVLGALAWTVSDVLDIVALRREAVRFDQEAAALEARFQAVAEGMPVTAVPPHNMKLVVNLESMIERNVPLPNVQLAILSGVLDTLPEVQINKLHWQAVEPATLAVPVDPAAPPVPMLEDFAPPPGLLGVPDPSAQILTIEGQIEPFTGNYRAAMESVALLAARLNGHPGVRAEVVLQPLDTRPTVKLDNVAGAGAGGAPALFVVKATWKR